MANKQYLIFENEVVEKLDNSYSAHPQTEWVEANETEAELGDHYADGVFTPA